MTMTYIVYIETHGDLGILHNDLRNPYVEVVVFTKANQLWWL